LFRRSFPEAAIATAPPQGPFDARLPLMDAAQRLRPTLGAFPTHAGYLKADSIRVHALRERYGRAGQKLVGLSWRSSAAGMVGFKSTDLMQWKAILQTPGVGFVCLQYGDVADDVRAAAAASGIDVRVDTTIDPLGDLDAYAAQVAAMDLVISVSNTAVHVAGAMNVPTWVMTPQGRGRHWYWFKDRTDSPWYPSVRIFGQSQPDRWDHTLDDIGAQLRQWACP
jgi:hypothetical protein